ncbi:MAG: hypothetical protein D4R43_02625 [Sphingobacteriales bacterium]|nr:MAG: hypothetical protein D4R43_02625 [Sphingobacteriales bacterium]
MKLLLDQNISRKLVARLSEEFPESTHVYLIGMQSVLDLGVWKYARDNSFTLVTQDADFYELSLVNGFPPKVIWLRCGNSTTEFIYQLLMNHKESIQNFISEKEKLACLELY